MTVEVFGETHHMLSSSDSRSLLSGSREGIRPGKTFSLYQLQLLREVLSAMLPPKVGRSGGHLAPLSMVGATNLLHFVGQLDLVIPFYKMMPRPCYCRILSDVLEQDFFWNLLC